MKVNYSISVLIDEITNYNLDFNYIKPLFNSNLLKIINKFKEIKLNIPQKIKKKIHKVEKLKIKYLKFINSKLNYKLKNSKSFDLRKWCNQNISQVNNIFQKNCYEYYLLNNLGPLEQNLYNNFIDFNILLDIENKFHNKYSIVFYNKDIEVKVDFYYEKNQPKPMFIDLVIYRICLMLSLVKSKDFDNKILIIKIWLHNKKKLFNKIKCSSLNHVNINSGCTFKRRGELGCIYIWRKEECLKVLTHELIHALGLDYYDQTESVLNTIVQHFDIDNKKYINLFEAFTEIWATIINIINNDKIIDTKQVIFLLNLEYYFSLIQVSKILLFFGYSKFSDFYSNKKYKTKKLGKFKQQTSILSYYIFKSVLFYNLDNFLLFCYENNGLESPWKYRGSDRLLLNFILDTLNKTSYPSIIDYLLNNLKKEKYSLSLKMTLFDDYFPIF